MQKKRKHTGKGVQSPKEISGKKGRNRIPRRKKTVALLNKNLRDSSGKIIFDDSILCAQFMNDYVKGLKDITVQPEDIEDVSERYVPLIAEERYSDTVKKVKIPNKEPLYFISLIEHKTEVDYNVAIQVFRYIYQIWEDYEKEMEAVHKGISKTKDFRYPPVIPIVYYEGKKKWTASLEFKEKVAMQELFGDMIPNFTYQLVCLNDYSNQELLDKGDAISLMMLISKIREISDIEQFMTLPSERLNEIVKPLPEQLVKKIAQIFRVCLFSMNAPEDQVEEIVARVEEKKMARLFEGMNIDIQADWKRREEQLKQIAEGEQRLAEGEQKLAEGRQELAEGKRELAEGEQKLAEGKRELAEEKQELAEGKQELAEGKQELAEKMQDFQNQRETFIVPYLKIAFAEGKEHEKIERELLTIFELTEAQAREAIKSFDKSDNE